MNKEKLAGRRNFYLPLAQPCGHGQADLGESLYYEGRTGTRALRDSARSV